MTEQIRWKSIQGFPNYEVSDTGLVRNKRFNRVIYGSVNSQNGYRQVWLRNGENSKFKYIHRLVAEAYCSKEDVECVCVRHLDGDKLNNDYKNLIFRRYGEKC